MSRFQSELKECLERGESFIWTDKPKDGIVFRKADIILIPLSVFWCGFAIFWFSSALSEGFPIFFVLWGIPFLIAGLMFVFGRFFIDAKLRKHTFYGLTENRIIIKSGVFSRVIKSINIKALKEVELNEKKNGTGTILFGPQDPFASWGNQTVDSSKLEFIKNAGKVYSQIIEMQKNKNK